MHHRPKIFTACLGLAVVLATYVGWKLFLFTVDDAYIAFRYAANSLVGHGLTWNPPPFRPVEGYSSFLWVVLLREVWRVLGVEPPVAANYISLLFGYATLFLGYKFLARMRLPAPLASRRWTLVALVMLGTITNRTFLAWLSSGLETSLFNFLFTWWVYVGTTDAVGRLGDETIDRSNPARANTPRRPARRRGNAGHVGFGTGWSSIRRDEHKPTRPRADAGAACRLAAHGSRTSFRVA